MRGSKQSGHTQKGQGRNPQVLLNFKYIHLIVEPLVTAKGATSSGGRCIGSKTRWRDVDAHITTSACISRGIKSHIQAVRSNISRELYIAPCKNSSTQSEAVHKRIQNWTFAQHVKVKITNFPYLPCNSKVRPRKQSLHTTRAKKVSTLKLHTYKQMDYWWVCQLRNSPTSEGIAGHPLCFDSETRQNLLSY